MPAPNDHQLALRIPKELLQAIDDEVERVKASRPGARVQRSDVVREALMRAFFKQEGAGPSGLVKRARTNGDRPPTSPTADRPRGPHDTTQ